MQTRNLSSTMQQKPKFSVPTRIPPQTSFSDTSQNETWRSDPFCVTVLQEENPSLTPLEEERTGKLTHHLKHGAKNCQAAYFENQESSDDELPPSQMGLRSPIIEARNMFTPPKKEKKSKKSDNSKEAYIHRRYKGSAAFKAYDTSAAANSRKEDDSLPLYRAYFGVEELLREKEEERLRMNDAISEQERIGLSNIEEDEDGFIGETLPTTPKMKSSISKSQTFSPFFSSTTPQHSPILVASSEIYSTPPPPLPSPLKQYDSLLTCQRNLLRYPSRQSRKERHRRNKAAIYGLKSSSPTNQKGEDKTGLTQNKPLFSQSQQEQIKQEQKPIHTSAYPLSPPLYSKSPESLSTPLKVSFLHTPVTSSPSTSSSVLTASSSSPLPSSSSSSISSPVPSTTASSSIATSVTSTQSAESTPTESLTENNSPQSAKLNSSSSTSSLSSSRNSSLSMLPEMEAFRQTVIASTPTIKPPEWINVLSPSPLSRRHLSFDEAIVEVDEEDTDIPPQSHSQPLPSATEPLQAEEAPLSDPFAAVQKLPHLSTDPSPFTRSSLTGRTDPSEVKRSDRSQSLTVTLTQHPNTTQSTNNTSKLAIVLNAEDEGKLINESKHPETWQQNGAVDLAASLNSFQKLPQSPSSFHRRSLSQNSPSRELTASSLGAQAAAGDRRHTIASFSPSSLSDEMSSRMSPPADEAEAMWKEPLSPRAQEKEREKVKGLHSAILRSVGILKGSIYTKKKNEANGVAAKSKRSLSPYTSESANSTLRRGNQDFLNSSSVSGKSNSYFRSLNSSYTMASANEDESRRGGDVVPDEENVLLNTFKELTLKNTAIPEIISSSSTSTFDLCKTSQKNEIHTEANTTFDKTKTKKAASKEVSFLKEDGGFQHPPTAVSSLARAILTEYAKEEAKIRENKTQIKEDDKDALSVSGVEGEYGAAYGASDAFGLEGAGESGKLKVKSEALPSETNKMRWLNENRVQKMISPAAVKVLFSMTQQQKITSEERSENETKMNSADDPEHSQMQHSSTEYSEFGKQSEEEEATEEKIPARDESKTSITIIIEKEKNSESEEKELESDDSSETEWEKSHGNEWAEQIKKRSLRKKSSKREGEGEGEGEDEDESDEEEENDQLEEDKCESASSLPFSSDEHEQRKSNTKTTHEKRKHLTQTQLTYGKSFDEVAQMPQQNAKISANEDTRLSETRQKMKEEREQREERMRRREIEKQKRLKEVQRIAKKGKWGLTLRNAKPEQPSALSQKIKKLKEKEERREATQILAGQMPTRVLMLMTKPDTRESLALRPARFAPQRMSRHESVEKARQLLAGRTISMLSTEATPEDLALQEFSDPNGTKLGGSTL
ncbi:uncharacterized protein MONOS_9061 [Monocercomonoides exilis]|uniref:uncharacterized protein n=1 Tax=Monocercomonoides exilis TaxID=2049356 RepID=UPI00355A0DE6|nr:hypothetical protein MONOS_9061 [Monocercomonoides exilis]|eukprot:MONOS_9061.1-p1 / transcript=MONOS_9061.1 / gene=MONOS_9061 / organism=Monocercomonoides_exilis_PA203 / gene_product=unspecified product / transcript_product=unspecified product / location=Mono_scaffold00361:19473-23716(-) / protein_length=1348 / sequence_SO=supercontig / SO=protein_coding / is_pseudo=false